MSNPETLAPFKYELMSKQGGRRCFYDMVLGSSIDASQRIGCIVDYAAYLSRKLVEVSEFTEEEEADSQAAEVVYKGLRDHQYEYGNARTHDAIEGIDASIRSFHNLTPNQVFHAHSDPLVAKFYEIMVGMVSILQGDC